MHRRILFGVAAWLLGAVTATAGSLLAVSLLGQGITGTAGPLLTPDAVNRALGGESAERSATAGPSAARASVSASLNGPPAAPRDSPAASQASPAVPPASPAPSATAPSDGNGSAPAGTVLMSTGGTVVASCLAAGAYLNSWSPSQGYYVGTVSRGPAATAGVTFESGGSAVIMAVSCSAGVPSAVTYTHDSSDD